MISRSCQPGAYQFQLSYLLESNLKKIIKDFFWGKLRFLGMLPYFWLFFGVVQVLGQLSTDPRLCGGYMRMVNDYIDFRFNENTAPPGVAQGKKFCMWTISPTVPTEYFRFNMTIRNVILNCTAGDKIAINYFHEDVNDTDLGLPATPGMDNPLCIQEHEVWRREHTLGTVMVVILYVEEVVYGKGFYLEWEPGYDSRITPSRIRNTYYSWGRPSVAPNPYFAAGFNRNEISTFGFVKANYTDGYQMEMFFDSISFCEGQGDWEYCFNSTLIMYSIQDNCTLSEVQRWHAINKTEDPTPAVASPNGFFIIVKVFDAMYAGARFSMIFDTVRG